MPELDHPDDDFDDYTLLSKACEELEPVIDKQFQLFSREYGHVFVDAARGEEEHKAEYDVRFQDGGD